MEENYRASSLKFSLDEVVSFRKGEEIEELVTISLEPNVAIHESDHYISIRGKLEMFGEYKKKHLEEEDELLSFSGQKFAQVRESADSDVFEFFYDMPVDITIPKTRIRSLEELEFKIDSFDYHLPNPYSLELSADLSVNGVYEEYYEKERTEKEIVEYTPYESHYDELSPYSLEEEEEDHFILSARKREDQKEVPEEFYLTDTEEIAEDNEGETDDEDNVGESFLDKNLFPNVTSYGEQPFPEVRSEVEVTEKETERVTAKRENQEELVDGPYRADKEPHPQEDTVGSISPMTEERDQRKEKSIHYSPQETTDKEKEDISLVAFFSRKEEEERQAKMRVYIVQEDDTLPSIAEKYNVNVSQIVRLNRLDSHHDLTKGQVLYIQTTVE